jgi:hypothetical protein
MFMTTVRRVLASGGAVCCPAAAADRIETMRRQIGVASVAAGADQVQLLELLGEGTYGKVYKGEPLIPPFYPSNPQSLA